MCSEVVPQTTPLGCTEISPADEIFPKRDSTGSQLQTSKTKVFGLHWQKVMLPESF